MNKITNASMFNWAKKKQKYETEEQKVRRKGSFSSEETKVRRKGSFSSEEPKIQRKGSFSLTDTLRRSVIKAKFKGSKDNISTKKDDISTKKEDISTKKEYISKKLEDISTKKEDISTKPPRPQPPIKNTQLPKETAPLAKPENVDLSNEISQITLQVSQMTADAQLSTEELKINNENVPNNKDPKTPIDSNMNELNEEKLQKLRRISQDSPIYDDVPFETVEELKINNENVPHKRDMEYPLENNTDELNKEEVQKSKGTTQNNPVYDKVNFETTQITPQVLKMTVEDAQLNMEELKVDDENLTHKKDLESPLENNEDELNKEGVQKFKRILQDSPVYDNVNFETIQITPQVSQTTVENAQLNMDELKIDDENVLHNKDLESPIENNEDESNKENAKETKRITQDSPIYVNVNFKAIQIKPQVSQIKVDDAKLDMEKLKIEDENVIHNNERESPIENNDDESNKEDLKSIIESLNNSEDVNVKNETTQLTDEVSKITTDDAQLKMEELKIEDEIVINNNDRESPIENNGNELNKEEERKSKIESLDSSEDINVKSETTQLMDEESKITNDDAQLNIEELKIKDENILHNNDQESRLENTKDESNKEEVQNSKRISHENPEDVNVKSETTQLTLQVSQLSDDDAHISIGELKINDENVIHNKKQQTPLEVIEDESNKDEVHKLKRISQISFETEDMSFSKKEDNNLNNEESNAEVSDSGEIRRNSTIRRSIKLELTIIESQDTNTPRRNSRTSPEKESNRCSSQEKQTEYPEELNPFGEDDEEDTAPIVNSKKQNVNNNDYNPFGSESDTEDTIKVENKEVIHNECTSSTTRIKNKNDSEDKIFSRDEIKCAELPGGSLPPSPKAPARRRFGSLQCLNEYSDPTKKLGQSKKASSTLSQSNIRSVNRTSSSTLHEKGEAYINSEDNLNTNKKPTQLPKSSVSIHTTSSGISSAGSNPFDDDEDENEFEETSIINKPRLEVETQRIRSSSPSVSLNDSVLSAHSTPSKSLNPFDEDEEDAEFEGPNEFGMIRGATSRCSLAYSPGSSSSFRRGSDIRGSLPHTKRSGVKKRLAPLPPGQLPPISPDKRGYSHQMNGSLSSSSPRKVAPPRPPPPRVQKTT